MSPRQMLLAVAAAVVIQAGLWMAAASGSASHGVVVAGVLTVSWALVVGLAVSMSREIGVLRTELEARQSLHRATLDEVEQIATLNDMLMTMGRSKEVGLTFQGLARRVGRLVPCDRLGLALIKEGGREVQTFSARVSEPERRKRPRLEFEYNIEQSVFGQVIRTCEPVLIDDLSQHASEFQDATALAAEGFQSALVLPLISRNRAIGALKVVSRRRGAFAAAHRDALQPLAEVLAFAFVAQQQYEALDRIRSAETLAEISLSLSTEINGALQAIIGQCGVVAQMHPSMASEIDVLMGQAERIAALMERLRATATDRLHEAAEAMAKNIPTSPEAFTEEE